MTKKEFYEKWIQTFASNIPKSDLKKHVVSTGNLIWHIFSWDLLDSQTYFEGEKAKKAYNDIDKRGAIYIEWFKDDHTKDIHWGLNSSDALDEFVEVYVVAKDFSWTYIKTHESSLGPYFIKKDK